MKSFLEKPVSIPVIKERNPVLMCLLASAFRTEGRHAKAHGTRGKRQNALNANWRSGQQQQQQYSSPPHPGSFVSGSGPQRKASTNPNAIPEFTRARDGYVQRLRKDTKRPAPIALNAIGNGAQGPQRNVNSILKSPVEEEKNVPGNQKTVKKISDSSGLPTRMASSQNNAVFVVKDKTGTVCKNSPKWPRTNSVESGHIALSQMSSTCEENVPLGPHSPFYFCYTRWRFLPHLY